MCGAYGFLGTSGFKSSINILLRYQLSNKPEMQDMFNIRPTMKALVITRNSPNLGKLLPFGIKAPWSESQLLINAKSETVSQLRTFKTMFKEGRCLVPASFFFEWQKQEDLKQPFCIKLKNTDVFSLAGLYNNEGFVILTTKPNKLMSPIHNRMPVILNKEDEDIWLDQESEEGSLTDLFAPFDANKMEAYPVSSLVNSAKNQSPEIIRKL
ncbi:MAG: SOS response-associated peptidase [Patescibacteria group bacterium]|nr:SOS response-associated peptidase [Patescibacteria group bacterium]